MLPTAGFPQGLHGGPGAPQGAILKHGLAEWQMRCGKDHVNKVESYRRDTSPAAQSQVIVS